VVGLASSASATAGTPGPTSWNCLPTGTTVARGTRRWPGTVQRLEIPVAGGLGTAAATAYGGPAAGMAVSQTGLAGQLCNVLFADSKHSLYSTVKRIAPGVDHIAVTQELSRARNPQEALAAASKFVDVTGTTAKVLKRVQCCTVKW